MTLALLASSRPKRPIHPTSICEAQAILLPLNGIKPVNLARMKVRIQPISTRYTKRSSGQRIGCPWGVRNREGRWSPGVNLAVDPNTKGRSRRRRSNPARRARCIAGARGGQILSGDELVAYDAVELGLDAEDLIVHQRQAAADYGLVITQKRTEEFVS